MSAVDGDEQPRVVLGVVAAPGVASGLAASMVHDLGEDLTARFPGVRWQVEEVVDGLVEPPAEDVEIVAAARRLLLDHGWDLVVCLTDLPLRVGKRPVVAHASPVQGVGLLSVPALGAVTTRRRLTTAVLRLVDGLLGDPDCNDDDTEAHRRRTRRLLALGTDVAPERDTFTFTARVLSGNLNLLAGMIWANRPWQLAARLSRALTAAVAAGVFALVTPDIWHLADVYGGWRLTAVSLGVTVAMAATVILGADLWERSSHPRMRNQVVLFNLATTGTVLIGVLAFYALVFLLALSAALLLVVPDLLAETLGHSTSLSDHVEIAWFTASLATAGGALGAGLESDEAVRQAAYTHRTNPITENGAA
ncbi:hypothetical protein [Nocardioides pakistanensis]